MSRPIAGETQAGASRLQWIDVAKGIGIVLVVYGHAVDGLISAGLLAVRGTAAFSFYAIYCFHMPLFFLLSGLFVPGRLVRDRARFVRRLIPTIAYPYFLWSAVQVVILYLAAAYVNKPRTTLGLADMLWSPPSQFWFLYSLFLFHVLAAALVWRGSAILILIAGGIGFAFFHALSPHGTVLRCSAEFLIFYAIGIACAGRIDTVQLLLTRYAGWWAAACLVALAYAWWGFSNRIDYAQVAMIPATFAGIAGAMALGVKLAGPPAAALRFLGERAMAIYLLHVLFVAGTRIVLAKLLGIDHGAALLPVLVVAGVAGPVVMFELSARAGWSERLGLGAKPRAAKASDA
jgi:fucose 4-O-acetylase-like acetyltransferase